MVSLVAQLVTLLVILSKCQALKGVSSSHAFCLASLQSASSVGGPSSKDDNPLESFFGLSWCCLYWVVWTFSPESDSGSVSSCSLKS